MADSDDDYMSNDLLAQIPDVRPGVSTSREQQRQLRISENRDAARRPPKRHELEAQRRQEALAQPMTAENKGFNLLAKMGYKPGMALGKQRAPAAAASADPVAAVLDTRLTEPIDMQLKLGRTGLGHEAAEKEQQVDRCEAHMKKMAERAKMTEVLTTDFRKRKRDVAVTRVLIADLVKARKACQELDLRIGVERPSQPHLWPVHKRHEAVETADDDTAASVSSATITTTTTTTSLFTPLPSTGPEKRPRLVVEQSVKYYYSNGVEAEAERDFNELDEEELQLRLDTVSAYVRERHSYCCWCGCAYESTEEMSVACPGTSKDDHD